MEGHCRGQPDLSWPEEIWIREEETPPTIFSTPGAPSALSSLAFRILGSVKPASSVKLPLIPGPPLSVFSFLKEKPTALVLKAARESYCLAVSSKYEADVLLSTVSLQAHPGLTVLISLRSVMGFLVNEVTNERTRELKSSGTHYSGCSLTVGRCEVTCGLGITCWSSFWSSIFIQLQETYRILLCIIRTFFAQIF